MLKPRLLSLVAATALTLLPASSAFATPINATLDFTFYQFQFAPQHTVSGTFGLILDDVTGQLSGVTSVNMEIAGKHYQTSEIVVGGFGTTHYITTNVNAWWEILAQTNDFYFSFGNLMGPANQWSPYFQYTTQNSLGGYSTGATTQFSLTLGSTTPPDEENPGDPGNPPAVPDSGSAAGLLALALIGLAAARRRLR